MVNIELERDENGMVNMTRFTEDYKNKFPQEYKERFGDASGEQVLQQFLNERIGNHE